MDPSKQRQAYEDAARVDERLNELVAERSPSDPEHTIYWLLLLRTVRSALDVIERAVPIDREVPKATQDTCYRNAMANFACQECGRKFRGVRTAERASIEGCPKCGSVDIDLA